MKVTKFKHATMLVEVDNVRLLIDPSGMAKGWQELTGLDAILVTHDHFDHVDAAGVAKLVESNPGTQVIANASASKDLEAAGVTVQQITAGDKLTIKQASVEGVGTQHAPIHGSFPAMGNTGLVIAGRFYYPGDSFEVPKEPVEIMALPTSGPWVRLGEAMDHLLAVKPQVAFPVHEGLTTMPDMHNERISGFAAQHGIEWVVIGEGETHEFQN